jgi:hypothetical protein
MTSVLAGLYGGLVNVVSEDQEGVLPSYLPSYLLSPALLPALTLAERALLGTVIGAQGGKSEYLSALVHLPLPLWDFCPLNITAT